jgi:DNA-binding MurR/RpiR family transcriptional regulator
MARASRPVSGRPDVPSRGAPPGELEGRLIDALPQLTAKRRRLARLLLDEPYLVAFASAEEIGERVGVDAATVVRFSRAIGYKGYADLKRAIQADVPRFMTPTEKLRQSIGDESTPAEMMQLGFAQDFANVELTASLNDEATLLEAVRLLADSKAILILAAGLSTPVGLAMALLLRLMGFPVVDPPAGVSAASEIAHLHEGDVAVGIGMWRYITVTVQLFAEAKATGAATIAITDSKASPLAQIADVTLISATGSSELSNSLVGPIAVVNALATGLALVDPGRAAEHLAEIDRIYRAADLTLE